MQPKELLQLVSGELRKVCAVAQDESRSGQFFMRVGLAVNDKLRELQTANHVQFSVAQWRELGFYVESDDEEAVIPFDAFKASLYGDNWSGDLRVALLTYMSFPGPEVLPLVVV